MHAAYDRLLADLVAACRGRYGAGLRAVAVYGSVGRGMRHARTGAAGPRRRCVGRLGRRARDRTLTGRVAAVQSVRRTEPCASSTPPARSGPASTTASRRSSAWTCTRCCAWSRRRSTSCCARRGRRARRPPCWRSATCSTDRATAACTPPSRPRARPATTWSRRCGRCWPDSARGRGRRRATNFRPGHGPAFSPSSVRTRRWARP